MADSTKQPSGIPGILSQFIDTHPYLVVFLLSLLMFHKNLYPDRVWSPADYLLDSYPWHSIRENEKTRNREQGDVAIQMNPWLIYSADRVKSGELPLWNPHSFAGIPFHANMQSAIFSPFNIPAYFMPVTWALNIQPILKTLVAGLSMLWFLRILGMGSFPALLGAIAFMFNGFLIVWLGAPEVSVAVWLPLLLGLTEKIRRHGLWRDAGLLALTVFIQFLGGHPETSAHLFLITVLYAAWKMPESGRSRKLAMFISALLAGTAMASFQILPFLDYLSRSLIYNVRQDSTLIPTNSLKAFIALIVPNFFGTPVFDNFWGESVGLINYHTISGAVGIVPWLLAPIAILNGRRANMTYFFLFITVASLVMVFEPVITPIILRHIPGYSLIAAATHRFRFVAALGLSGLAAIGLDSLLNLPNEAALLKKTSLLIRTSFASIIALTGISFLIFGIVMHELGATLYVMREIGIFLILASAAEYILLRAVRLAPAGYPAVLPILVVELACILYRAPSFNPVIPKSKFFPSVSAIEFLKSQNGQFRSLLPLPNIGMAYGLDTVGGYDAITPLRYARLMSEENLASEYGNDQLAIAMRPDSKLASLLNIKFILSRPDAPSPGRGYTLVYDSKDGRIFRNNLVLPRAFLVHRHVRLHDDDEVLRRIRKDLFEPGREILSQGTPGIDQYPEDPGATVRILSYTASRVLVQTSSSTPAYLVLSDRYSPRWNAYVDGRKVQLLRVDYVLRGVKLAAGRHQVEFRFFPLFFYIGTGISVVALLTVMLMFVAGRPARQAVPNPLY